MGEADAAAPVKYRKQEQEPASADVTEVASGVLRVQLPIDFTGLGHVNCYVLEDHRGVTVVDPGLPGRANLAALRGRLRSAGIPLRRVHTVVVTHSHPDHFGGAGWVRNESGARILTHRRFQVFWDRRDPPDVDVEDLATLARRGNSERRPWDPPPWGGPPLPWGVRRRLAFRFAARFPRLVRTPRPDQRLDDSQLVVLGGREWRAVHTPGHTDDHVCLLDEANGVLLSGDHVLPTITPHIGGWTDGVDPLDAFFGSLATVAELGPQVNTVLPAHGHPFSDLAGRAVAIRDHHLERLGIIRAAFEETSRPLTVPELSLRLFSPRAQGAMADAETYAHLEHLRRAEGVQRTERDGEFHYAPG